MNRTNLIPDQIQTFRPFMKTLLKIPRRNGDMNTPATNSRHFSTVIHRKMNSAPISLPLGT